MNPSIPVCFAVSLLAAVSVSGQYWCPPGSQWYHEYAVGMTQEVGYAVTTYVGDTLIGGRTAQRLQRYVHGYSAITQNYYVSGPGVMYTSLDDDLVETWNGSTYDTLFFFGAAPGQAWQAPGWSGVGAVTMTVLDTGHAMMAGSWLRYLVMDLGPFSNVPNGIDTLVERLGMLSAYIDIWNAFAQDGGYGALRCYSDVDLEFTRDSLPCDFILTLDEPEQRSTPAIFPNPGVDHLQIGNGQGPLTIVVFDHTGQAKLRGHLDGQGSFDVSTLASGPYLIVLSMPDGTIVQLRWAKE